MKMNVIRLVTITAGIHVVVTFLKREVSNLSTADMLRKLSSRATTFLGTDLETRPWPSSDDVRQQLPRTTLGSTSKCGMTCFRAPFNSLSAFLTASFFETAPEYVCYGERKGKYLINIHTYHTQTKKASIQLHTSSGRAESWRKAKFFKNKLANGALKSYQD